MEVSTEVTEAFQFLRPICVLVSQNHDVKSIKALTNVLESGALKQSVLQDMQEYIAFPLRLVLKQYGLKNEAICTATLRCLWVLLNKTSVSKTPIFIDLFSNILNFISSPQDKSVLSEDVRHGALRTLSSLFRNCAVSCYLTLLKEGLPLFGGLLAALLDIAVKERAPDFKICALNLLHTLVDDQDDKELKKLLEIIVPSYLPGFTLSATKIATAPNQKHRVTMGALKLMYNTLVISLSDKPEGVEIGEDNQPELSTYFSNADSAFLVTKTEEWYAQATKNLSLVIRDIASTLISHDERLVRTQMVIWAYKILINCHKRLPECRDTLLDVITHNVGDEYPDVSSRCLGYLTIIRREVDGVRELLEQRVYDIATKLPRKVSKHDGAGSLTILKIFNGYLSSLDTEVSALLRCHVHLQRISLALCYLLEVDCTGVNILESTKPEHLVATEAVFPVLRRQFVSFTDSTVWKEIQRCIHYFVKYGDLYTLTDHFITEYQMNVRHRLQCALILNEMMGCCVLTSEDVSKEVVDSCSAVLELYSDSYRRLQTDSTASSSSIKQRNEMTQLHCLIVEGLVTVHQVTGRSYPELLLHSLYSMLESCAHDNIIIKQTAVTGLSKVSKAFNYRDRGELIEKHCDYLCNTLSLNIRRLHRYPSSPLVLCSVLQHSQSTILPYIEQIIVEVLLSLDENYTEDAITLLRVPQVLLKQLCTWFPRSSHANNCINDNANGPHTTKSLDHSLPRKTCTTGLEDRSVELISRDICDFVKDYYQTRVTADRIDFSSGDDDEENGDNADTYAEEVDDLEQQEEENISKKTPPLYILITKKVLSRCQHLVSHPSTKVRLLTIDMISDACTILSTHSQGNLRCLVCSLWLGYKLTTAEGTAIDDLLPAIHDVWAGFSKRFSDIEPLVIIKAIDCLGILGDLSKDFIRARVSKDVLPNLVSLLHKKSATSLKSGKPYRHTLDYRLQLVVLETVGQLCLNLNLSFPAMEMVIESYVPYLSTNQPAKLQEVAVNSVQNLAADDADLVWFHLSNLAREDTAAVHKEFSMNAERIISRIHV